MADEIYLFRNETHELVPPNLSIVPIIDNSWTTIHKEIYDGRPFGYLIRQIEENISLRRAAIDGDALDRRYDWEYDLARARYNHRFNLSWMDWHKESRQKLVTFWTENAADGFKYAREVSLNGFKTIVLLHGAVALGSINILASYRRILVTDGVRRQRFELAI